MWGKMSLWNKPFPGTQKGGGGFFEYHYFLRGHRFFPILLLCPFFLVLSEIEFLADLAVPPGQFHSTLLESEKEQ